MKIPRFPRAFVIVFFMTGIMLPLTAQTLLLLVQESYKGGPLAPPLAVREGVAQSLFATGVVIVEVPPSYALPKDIPAFARGAGAEIILEVSARYTEISAGASRPEISVSSTFALTDAATGVILTRGTDEATNKNREAQVDRTALGLEIGGRIVAAAEKAMAAWVAGKS